MVGSIDDFEGEILMALSGPRAIFRARAMGGQKTAVLMALPSPRVLKNLGPRANCCSRERKVANECIV